MITSNIQLGNKCDIDTSSSINNISVGDGVKIAKGCSVFGSPEHILTIGEYTYVGMNSSIIGYADKIEIGNYVSIAQNVYIMSDSGPNNEILQKIFPIQKGRIVIGDFCWIGAGSIIMPNVRLGKACIVGANSFVNRSFDDYCVIGGSPANLIRKLTTAEINKLKEEQ